MAIVQVPLHQVRRVAPAIAAAHRGRAARRAPEVRIAEEAAHRAPAGSAPAVQVDIPAEVIPAEAEAIVVDKYKMK